VLNWVVTGRVCQGVGGVSEVGGVGKGRNRESVEGKERRRREGGRKRGNKEGSGRHASGGSCTCLGCGGMFNKKNKFFLFGLVCVV